MIHQPLGGAQGWAEMVSVEDGASTSLWVWVNYNELTTSSLEIIVSKGNHPQMALIQVSELLSFTQMGVSENREHP